MYTYKYENEYYMKGKSSLANALLGCDPRGQNDCLFGVCGGLDSCTKNTSIGTGQWLGDASAFTVKETFFVEKRDKSLSRL